MTATVETRNQLNILKKTLKAETSRQLLVLYYLIISRLSSLKLYLTCTM